MMKEKAQTLVTDQLYNLVAGFLYALSICYFAKGADFAPGGLSGLALLGNYLWGFPIGITTLVLNVPLILLGFRFVGRTFLGKTVISMLWCTFFQDVAFADQAGYGGDPLLAALFAGITWGGALALLYMRGSSSGGTDFLTMSIKVLRPHLSVGVVTGAIDLVSSCWGGLCLVLSMPFCTVLSQRRSHRWLSTKSCTAAMPAKC